MGNPKMKVTKSKRNQRRSHHHPTVDASGRCTNCGELKLTHTICPSCGHYGKKEVIKKNEL